MDNLDLKVLKSHIVSRSHDVANELIFNDNTMSAFHIACQYNQTNLVTFGVNNPNVDVNLVDGSGQTALVRALKSGSRNVLKILIKCDRIQFNVPDDANDNYNITLLEYIFDCCRKYDELKSRICGKNFVFNVNAKNSDGNAAIHCVCANSNIAALRLLIEDLHADINLKGKHGLTPLMIACSRKFNDAIHLLLNNLNIDPNIRNGNRNGNGSGYGNGNSALHYACGQFDNYDVIKALMDHKNIDPNICNNDGNTPFMILCAGKDFDENIFKLFLNNDNVDKHKINNYGENAFSCYVHLDNEIKRINFLRKMYGIAESQLIESLKK